MKVTHPPIRQPFAVRLGEEGKVTAGSRFEEEGGHPILPGTPIFPMSAFLRYFRSEKKWGSTGSTGPQTCTQGVIEDGLFLFGVSHRLTKNDLLIRLQLHGFCEGGPVDGGPNHRCQPF